MTIVRKNITLSKNSYQTINDFAKKSGMSFSEFLRESALKEINRNENLNLLNYINTNCSYLDNVEQKEIENMNINFDDIDGKELSLDDILQD